MAQCGNTGHTGSAPAPAAAAIRATLRVTPGWHEQHPCPSDTHNLVHSRFWRNDRDAHTATRGHEDEIRPARADVPRAVSRLQIPAEGEPDGRADRAPYAAHLGIRGADHDDDDREQGGHSDRCAPHSGYDRHEHRTPRQERVQDSQPRPTRDPSVDRSGYGSAGCRHDVPEYTSVS